jgi:hypothetical protein
MPLRRPSSASVRSASRVRSTWAAFLGVVGLVLATVVGVPLVATAAVNTGIVVDVELATVDGEQATVGDTISLSGTWDATTANPQPGDQFTMQLPIELEFPATMPLELVGADGTVWGTCLVDAETGLADCTLTAEVVDRPEEVRGTFQLDVVAVAATDEPEVVFEINGEARPVALPGGGIDDGVELPVEWSKTGSLNANKWSVTWSIVVPGSLLAGNAEYTIDDHLGAGHVLCEPSGLVLESYRDPSSPTAHPGLADVQVGADPADLQFTLTAPEGGFDADRTYRLRYQSCTPDGEIDPLGTEYRNEATVEGETKGVGVGQDWQPSATPGKSGSLQGGDARQQYLTWTVTVPGTMVAGESSFTIDDALSGPQAVCTDDEGQPTLAPITVWERYGPSNDRRVNVTGELSFDADYGSATAFSLDVEAGDGFAFQGLNYFYVVQYRTCVTTDGLPEAGTQFGNTAGVDGVEAETTVTVPPRSEGKSGRINTTAVTLGGVEHLPQTTLGWTITVPGEIVHGQDTPLTLTDTLSASHLVCEGDGTVGDRLGLQVRAIDQVSGGGLATVDLEATATETDDGVVIVVQPPALPLPGGGTSDGFSREYQYVVDYTTCTASGGMDAPGTSYGNTVTGVGGGYGTSVTQSFSGSGTGQGVPRGSFALQKVVTGAGADLVPEDAVFTVQVQEVDPTGTVQTTYPVELSLDGEPVSGFNARGTGWTIVLSEIDLPEIPGIVFGTPRFTADPPAVTTSEDGSVATVRATPQSNVEVVLTNDALLGSIEVVKEIAGPASELADPDQPFSMTASIDVSALGEDFPAQPDREFTIRAADAEPYVLSGLPVGATVTFSEQLPAAGTGVVWGTPTISPESVVVTAEHVTDPALVTVTNQAGFGPGTFSIAKAVTGVPLGHADVPESVAVEASWTDGAGDEQTKELVVPTDGTRVPFGEQLPYGTEVTLSETALDDAPSFTWGAPEWSGDGVEPAGDGTAVVTIGAGTDAEVVLTNAATESTGSVAVTKEILGDGADDVPTGTAFPVVATWTDLQGAEQRQEFEVEAGRTVVIDGLPLGVEVRFAEGDADPSGLPEGVEATGAAWTSGDEGVALVSEDDAVAVVVLTGAPGAEFALTLHNTVERSDTDGEGTGTLPDSGGLVGPLLLLGGLALVAAASGAVLVRRARRARAAAQE